MPRRAEALGDSPPRSLGPNRCSRRAHRLGGSRRAPRRDRAEKSGEEAAQGRARRTGDGAGEVASMDVKEREDR